MKILFKILIVFFLSSSSLRAETFALLSEYNFFQNIKGQVPNKGVIPYHIANPLFSDYTYKFRFVSMPDGSVASYNHDQVFDFPIGTTIIKTFAYPVDDRNLKKGFQLLETRLLIHKKEGWIPVSYIWNDNQTDAEREFIGKTIETSWVDKNGVSQNVRYRVPNINQCKSCHQLNKVIKPIGPKGRNMNVDFLYEEGKKNQLEYWEFNELLIKLPKKKISKPAIWDNELFSVPERARAYLDSNCAHCHRKGGSAGNSGFYLSLEQADGVALGIRKRPVAAGRGSGGMAYVIDPGKPEDSILLYRMASTDPGIMMPELSRSLNHKEALPLIYDWIKEIE